MNNAKKSVLACLTLALFIFGSFIEAKGRKDKECCDPIVGTWNIRLEVIPPMPPTPGVTLIGVATFSCDGRVTFATIPTNPVSADATFSTQSYGTWKKCGSCEYKVVLSSVNNPSMVRDDARIKAEITIVIQNILNDLRIVSIGGTYSFFSISDECFSGTPIDTIDFMGGSGCKLDSAGCCN